MPKTRRHKQTDENSEMILEELKKLHTRIDDIEKISTNSVHRTIPIHHEPCGDGPQYNERQSNNNASSDTNSSQLELHLPLGLEAPQAPFQAPRCVLPSFDGTGSLKKFQTHFSDVSIINNWNLQQQGIWLKMCLEGKARDILHDDSHDYKEIMDRLNGRFGDHLLRKQYEILLPTRKRKPNETLADLASDIRQMSNIVYKELNSEIQEQMTMKHFIMAMEPPAAQYELSQSQAKTLDDLVSTAQVLRTRKCLGE